METKYSYIRTECTHINMKPNVIGFSSDFYNCAWDSLNNILLTQHPSVEYPSVSFSEYAALATITEIPSVTLN
jgi:hypothetical protein